MAVKTAKDKSTHTRLREILSVLRRRKLHKGLTPEKLRLILEDLGATYIKLGQIASTKEDMLPPEYCRELTKLRTMVAVVPVEEIRGIIAAECGKPVDSLFSSFVDAPIGAASIAQVHNATLLDGQSVVVKVQRPGVREVMERDMELLRKAAGLVNRTKFAGDMIDFKVLLGELWEATRQELDFVAEAGNIEEFARRNADVRYVSCPRVYPEYSTANILVMERVEGIPIDDRVELQKQGYDLRELGDKLVENYVKQVLEDAYFHADPHPGNIIIRDGVIVWIDLGMMGRLRERDRVLIKKAMTAVVERDVLTIKEVLLTIGSHSGRVNHARLYADIDDYLVRYGSMTLQEATTLNMSEMLDELTVMAKSHGISMPKGITMLGRGMMVLESLLLQLNPDVDFITVMANHLSKPLHQSQDTENLLGDISHALLVSLKKGVHIPGQLSDLLRLTTKGQTKINHELDGSEEWNRLLTGQVNKLVLAFLAVGLFVGSSILADKPLTPAICGIPAPAFAGYLLSGLFIIKLLLWIRKKK